MGMRFRKSFGIKGARVNLSKSGIGCSVGTKGARYTKLANGRTKTTLSVPGTGLSYVSESGNGSKGNSTGSVAAQTSLKEQSAGMLKAARTSAPKVSTTPQGQDANEDIVAITMALHEHLGGEHDVENMVLTFNEVGPSHSPWSLKIFGLRKR